MKKFGGGKRMGGKKGAVGMDAKAGPIATPFVDAIQKGVGSKKLSGKR